MKTTRPEETIKVPYCSICGKVTTSSMVLGDGTKIRITPTDSYLGSVTCDICGANNCSECSAFIELPEKNLTVCPDHVKQLLAEHSIVLA